MKDLVKKIFILLSPSEKKKLYFLFFAIFIISCIDVIGITTIMPFIGVVASPELITENKYLNYIYTTLNFSSSNSFLIFLGLVVLTVLVLSNSFTAFVYFRMYRFNWNRNYTFSMRLFSKYLNQKYVFFLHRNSSDLSKNILNEINQVINGVTIPLLELASKFVTAFLILVLLLVVNPILAVIISVVLGGCYFIIYKSVQKRLNYTGEKRIEAARAKFKIAAEAFGGIKDVKLLGKENSFLRLFSKPAKETSHYFASNQSIAMLPRYALEVIAFGGILIIILYLLYIGSSVAEVLPLIALYAFAGYRLMPSLQAMFTASARIKFYTPALNSIYRDFNENGGFNYDFKFKDEKPVEKLHFKNSLELKDIFFKYPSSPDWVIKGIDLKIEPNTTIGFVGSTGCGKTTFIDIILGLLEQQKGSINVDNIIVNPDNMKSWQQNLGYVPQQIYLTDSTIAENIAFGIPSDKIKMNEVIEASKISNLYNFVMTLPEGFDTVVGEKGVRLSGGQRQRIGIARALYTNPELLILDEATSSLDNLTEYAVMDAINNLSHKKTIIIIAHRLSTVKECDIIYYFENGKITDSGRYEDLLFRNERFKELATISSNV
ncbi:MAG TPA: ABC transporter ATP-binding protein/permease [Ignavibacteria bacterium]|nr:ABC transporter ATP-binding protein/permease [Ignavibacteria bacterium]